MFGFYLYRNGVRFREHFGVLLLLSSIMLWGSSVILLSSSNVFMLFSVWCSSYEYASVYLVTALHGHLGCWQIGEIMSSTVRNFPLHVFWRMYIHTFLLDTCLKMELVGPRISYVFSGLIDINKHLPRKSYQSYISIGKDSEIFVLPYPCHHLILSALFALATLVCL